MQPLVIRGLPRKVEEDAWWIGAESSGVGGGIKAVRPSRLPVPSLALPLLAALIALADVLFWAHAPGLSLAIFCLALVTAALGAAGRHTAPRDRGLALLVAALILLPVIEHVQTLSVLFMVFGTLAVLGWIALGSGSASLVLSAMLRVVPESLLLLFDDATEAKGLKISAGRVRSFWVSWLVPMGAGAVFLILFIQANPIFEDAALSVDRWLTAILNADRILFWLCLAPLLWPVLRLAAMSKGVSRPVRVTLRPRQVALLNAVAVRNAMIVFNLMFAVQSVTDLGILWGGAALPEGMTYAEYAHRGAYPLVATALLAGLFAVAARRHLGAGWVRALMYLWLAQNLLLVASSAFRLELYVEVYGLTYLRVHAAIWMGLVAVGIASVIWMIARDRGVGWLLSVNAGVAVLVLYAMSFVNVAGVIAGHNLSPGFTGQIDAYYLCGLPEGAFPAIQEWEDRTGGRIWPDGVTAQAPHIEDWREWGFRRARVQHYFETRARELQP